MPTCLVKQSAIMHWCCGQGPLCIGAVDRDEGIEKPIVLGYLKNPA